MPSKNTKQTRRAGNKKDDAPAAKDDGTRWLVVRHGEPVYISRGGTTKAEALRLAAGLREPAQVMQVS